MVGTILDLSKLEAKKMEVRWNPELLFPLARRIAAAFESQAQIKDIRYTFHYKAEQDLYIELDKNITGKEAENVLVEADITVNKNMVPFDDQSPFVTSGIRIGTPAITTRGLVEADMDFVAESIDSSIKSHSDDKMLSEIGKKVESYMIERPLFTNS